MSDSERRYAEIMRKLAEREAEKARQPQRERQHELARILENLDAAGKLAAIQRTRALRGMCWGPKNVQGETPSAWVGVLLWRRGSGYHGYKQLQIAGVWAFDQDDETQVVFGSRYFPYTAPTYEAEAYQKLMKRGYDIYYRVDPAPPPTHQWLFSAVYRPSERLALRETLREQLSRWAAG